MSLPFLRNLSIGAKLSCSTFALVGSVFLIFILFTGHSASEMAKANALREVADKTKMLADTVEPRRRGRRHARAGDPQRRPT